MRRIARWLVLGTLGIFTATACRDAFGIEDVLGTWYTTSIDGQSVPGTVTVDGHSFNIQYFAFTFSEAGACVQNSLIDDLIEIVDLCEYTVNLEQKGITVELFGGDFDFEGSIDGRRMTLTDAADYVWVFRRQF